MLPFHESGSCSPTSDDFSGVMTEIVTLTLSMLSLKRNNSKIFENHLNPIILVFIGKLSSSTFK